ncbi:MAG: hypothetical protein IT372_08305 [Polyangiaceae bacterium]|nr:hypothetical protein [Polyangiaceae bacterium]
MLRQLDWPGDGMGEVDHVAASITLMVALWDRRLWVGGTTSQWIDEHTILVTAPLWTALASFRFDEMVRLVVTHHRGRLS